MKFRASAIGFKLTVKEIQDPPQRRKSMAKKRKKAKAKAKTKKAKTKKAPRKKKSAPKPVQIDLEQAIAEKNRKAEAPAVPPKPWSPFGEN